jgi:tol-pal system protein YbgF
MIARPSIGAWIVVLALGGCAGAAAAPQSTHAPMEDPVTQLRRDNAALRRRVQMLEDRVLYLEGGGRSPGVAGTSVQGEHTLPDGRSLPVVRLAPPPGRATPHHGAEPEPEAADDGDEDGDGYVPASASEAFGAEGDDHGGPPARAARSFRLEGSRLVDLTVRAGPAAPDRPDRGAKGQPIIEEYEAAMALYESGHAERAEAAFSTFARRHPQHDYADNALYWKGEAAYDQDHFGDALAAFTEVVERYGGGNKAPDALLKIGLCYRRLGDVPNARDVLTELVAAYPSERASDIARVKLLELES